MKLDKILDLESVDRQGFNLFVKPWYWP